MKGVRFYLDYYSEADKKKASGRHKGNVIAVLITQKSSRKGFLNGYGAMYEMRNSPVEFFEVNESYLKDRCRRVSEKIATKIHPRLIETLKSYERI